MDRFRHGHLDSDYGHGDMRLKEDLADAMRESPSTAAARRDPGKCRDEFQNHNLGLLFSNICFVYCIETVLKRFPYLVNFLQLNFPNSNRFSKQLSIYVFILIVFIKLLILFNSCFVMENASLSSVHDYV